MEEAEICLASNLGDALASLEEAVSRFVGEEPDDGGLAFKLNLVLDELVTNSISYGLAGAEVAQLRLRLRRSVGGVVAQVEDNGPAFNPFVEAKPPDTTVDVADRPIGGLGVYFVKHFVDSFQYERVDGTNRITLTLNREDEESG